MEQKIILIMATENYTVYGGTFYDCTYTIQDSFNDKKSLSIFCKGNCIYGNNANSIEVKECINEITEEKEIKITLNKKVY